MTTFKSINIPSDTYYKLEEVSEKIQIQMCYMIADLVREYLDEYYEDEIESAEEVERNREEMEKLWWQECHRDSREENRAQFGEKARK